MPDTTYGPKVYKESSGDRQIVASGGEISVETGGKITANGTQASAIASLTDSSGGTASDTVEAVGGAYSQSVVANNFADLTAKVNAILVALRGAGIIAS